VVNFSLPFTLKVVNFLITVYTIFQPKENKVKTIKIKSNQVSSITISFIEKSLPCTFWDTDLPNKT